MKPKHLDKSGKRSIGVYLSSHYVDVVELKSVAGKIKLQNALHLPIRKDSEEGYLLDTSFEKTGLIRDKLSEVERKLGKTQQVVCALRPKDSVARFFTMPRVSEKDRANAIKFEAKKYIPFRLDEIYSNSFVVNEDTRLGQMGVLFVGGKREQVNHLLGVVESAGLKSYTIDTVACSLIRTFEYNQQIDPNVTSMIVYIEKETASIIIIKQSIPYLIRDIYFLPDETNVVDKVIQEVGLSIDFFKRQFPTDVLNKILLVGDQDFSTWKDNMKQSLSVVVEEGDLTKESIGVAEGTSSEIAVAYGLALKQLEKTSKVDVNLLPESRMPVRTSEQKDIFKQVGVVVAILFLFALYFNKPMFAIQKRIRSIRKHIPEVSEQLKNLSVQQLQTKRKNLEDKLSLLNPIIGDRGSVTKKLTGVAGLIPKDAWITSLNYTEVLAKNDKTGYVRSQKRSLKLSGIIASSSRQDERDRAYSLVDTIKEKEDIFDGFKDAKLLTSKTIVIGNDEATSFELDVTSE